MSSLMTLNKLQLNTFYKMIIKHALPKFTRAAQNLHTLRLEDFLQ